jgi:hypothetical protein
MDHHVPDRLEPPCRTHSLPELEVEAPVRFLEPDDALHHDGPPARTSLHDGEFTGSPEGRQGRPECRAEIPAVLAAYRVGMSLKRGDFARS